MIDIKRLLFQWFIIFLTKRLGSGIKSKDMLNKELAEELHKPIIKKFEKRKVK